MNANQEIGILTAACMLAAAALQAEDAGQKERTIARLQQYESAIETVAIPAHMTIKRLVQQTVRSAIRFLQTDKQSDAKLTRRNGADVAAEFGRLKRAAQRRGAV